VATKVAAVLALDGEVFGTFEAAGESWVGITLVSGGLGSSGVELTVSAAGEDEEHGDLQFLEDRRGGGMDRWG
jgi:hypothetical protein